MKKTLLLANLILSAALLATKLASVTQAATFNIANGDVAGLIAAIQTANASGGSNTINLASQGIYTLTMIAEGEAGGYHGPTGLPNIHSQLTINGNGATIQRSNAAGTPLFGIFLVIVGNLTLDGVTLTGGNAVSTGFISSGGLANDTGTVVIRNSTITQNLATYGGGIFNFCGTLSVVNSTISYNTSDSGYGGGGILNFGNGCNNPPYFTATSFLSFSTIFENQNALGRGDSIADAFSPGSIFVKNSILASPTRSVGGACYAGLGVVSSGHNIAGDATCGLTGAGDMSSTNPTLGPTANNGGPTPTDLPLLGSPAIGGVPMANCTDVGGVPITTDQRGVARPQGSACDIGSVEVVQRLYNVCLLYDATKAANSGATLPIKLTLCDGSGNDLSSSSIVLHAAGITRISTSITGPVQDSGNANPDNDFRFDSTLGPTGGYIFNLSTKGLATGSYNLNFTVTGDSFVYAAPFQVK